MTFFDFLKDLNDTAKERLKTPITGAFVFSFLIYNWRPIVLLFFSEASIEFRINAINNKYCSPFAIIIPIIIAFIYTVIVPGLSVLIDIMLKPIKKERIKGIYTSKTITIDEKIILAKKELDLKDAESGNKEKQDFLDKISILEKTIEQLKISHDNITKGDQQTIKQLNERLEKLMKVDNDFVAEIDSIMIKNKTINVKNIQLEASNMRILNQVIKNQKLKLSVQELKALIELKFDEKGFVKADVVNDKIINNLIKLQYILYVSNLGEHTLRLKMSDTALNLKKLTVNQGYISIV